MQQHRARPWRDATEARERSGPVAERNRLAAAAKADVAYGVFCRDPRKSCAQNTAAAIVMPAMSSEAITEHLEEISTQIGSTFPGTGNQS